LSFIGISFSGSAADWRVGIEQRVALPSGPKGSRTPVRRRSGWRFYGDVEPVSAQTKEPRVTETPAAATPPKTRIPGALETPLLGEPVLAYVVADGELEVVRARTARRRAWDESPPVTNRGRR